GPSRPGGSASPPRRSWTAPLLHSSVRDLLGLGCPSGQRHDHAAAVRVAPLGMDVASVELDDPLRDRQTEPGAAVARRARGAGSVEALEHAALLGFGDAGAL